MVAQSSLSHSISELERELNVKLFYRNGRNVKLTKHGAFYLEYVKKALDTLEDGNQKLQDLVSPSKGKVTLSYLSSLDPFITYMISKYYRSTGEIEKRFKFYQAPSSEIYNRLMDGTVDLAFSTQFDNDKLDSCVIGKHRSVLIVSKKHPLARKDSVDLAEIRDEKLITYSGECQMRVYIDSILKKFHISPSIILETVYDNIIIGSVAANFGVAIIPEPLAPVHNNVKVLTITNDIPHREMCMIWVKDRYMPPAVKNFKNYVTDNGMILNEFIESAAIEQTIG